MILDLSLKSQQLELHFMELYHAKVEDSKYKAQRVEAKSISATWCTILRNSCTLLLLVKKFPLRITLFVTFSNNS